MWGVSCLLQEGIREKTGENQNKKKRPKKIYIPVEEANADVKGC
jgi:hypothetical protein